MSKPASIVKKLGLSVGWRRGLRPGLRVLTYHDLPPPRVFRDHIQLLKEESHLVGLPDVVSLFRNEREWPTHETEVFITADDGYATQFGELHLEVVSDAQVHPHVFLIGAALDPAVLADHPHLEIDEAGRSRPLVSESALREGLAAGWTVGAHTWTHPNPASLSPSELKDEVVGGADRIAQILQREIDTFAWPWGRRANASTKAFEIARNRFIASFSTEAGNNRFGQVDPQFVRRDVIGCEMSAKDVRAILAGALDGFRSLRQRF